MSRSRFAIGIAVAGAALAAVAAVALVYAPNGERKDDLTASPTNSAPLPTQTGPSPGSAGVRPPNAGAYLGAWVKPPHFTEASRVAAREDFESDVGRRLDIVHDYHTWSDEFPSDFDREIARSGAIPLISWGGTDTRLIAMGDDDDLIRRRAREIRAFRTPILLRWRWEMDRPNLQGEIHSPADYVAAWKRIRAMFAAEGATNASFVWCPLAEGFDNRRAPAYYPGDDQVDWLCTDAYALEPTEPLARLLGTFLSWSKGRHKPIVIGEFGTQPGRPGARARWLAELPALVRKHPQIKAMVYFDSDDELGGDARNWSLRTNAEDLSAFSALARSTVFNARRLSVSGTR